MGDFVDFKTLFMFYLFITLGGGGGMAMVLFVYITANTNLHDRCTLFIALTVTSERYQLANVIR